MRMQKEEKIVVVLLLMALGSLAIAEWAFGIRGELSDFNGKKEIKVARLADVELIRS